MAKLKSLAEIHAEKIEALAPNQGIHEPSEIELMYLNYLKILECWENKADDSEFSKNLVAPANAHRDGLTSRTFVIRNMFDLMITTVSKNNSITATQLLDDILIDFFSRINKEDLKPLTLKQFTPIIKKRLSQRGKTSRYKAEQSEIKTLKLTDKKEKK